MPEIKHDITINATCETVYQALTTEKGLSAWFTPHVVGSGKLGTDWELSFTDQPFFRWQILKSEKPHDVAWKCIEGPGNAPDTEVEFKLKSTGQNKTALTISHRGWSKEDPKFTRCVEIWRTLINHLQQYCEAGVTKPAYH